MTAHAVLSAGDLADALALLRFCNEFDGLDTQLDLEGAGEPAGTRTRRLLARTSWGQLVGVACLDGARESEMCGVVHPSFRRRGIGRTLLEAALAESRTLGSSTVLLGCDSAFGAAAAFAAAAGFYPAFAEYHMDLLPERVPQNGSWEDVLSLEVARGADAHLVAGILTEAFDEPQDEALLQPRAMEDPAHAFMIARWEGRAVGVLRVRDFGVRRYITAFGVLPAFQRRGFGRQMLTRTVQSLVAAERLPVSIEVVTDNLAALELYHSCGFEETRTYVYHRGRL